MTYPGNASLSGAVKDRVLSTFQQALTLYDQGRKEEVVAGCTLILQMDPMFDPAKKLLEKTRNPSLPIDVHALLPTSTSDGRSPMDQAREAMAARDFQRVAQITTEILTDDLLNDDARVLGDEARERMEASPFVEQFTRKCDQLLASGNVAAAKVELEKARALDPTHPEVVRVANKLAAPERPAAPPPSFIVDDKSAPPPSGTGRSTAQAADFGFSFEEEKPAEVSFSNFSFDAPAQGFSFDTPSSAPSSDSPFSGFSFGTPSPAAPPAAKAPAAGEFDFATASVATTPDDQKKIEQYLSDGDRAFEAGDYQQAIDLWSRIFLIDVTNDQASERIERAKARRREIEAKVETILSAGITAFDRGDTAKAHAELSEVLRLDPNNTTAQEYLDRLGETATEGGASARAQTFIPPSVSDEKLDLGFFEEESSGGFETPLIPPDRTTTPPAIASGKRAAPATPAKTKPASERKLPVGVLVTILGVLVLGAGGWFAWSKFFNKPEADFSATQSTLDRAAQLAARGKYDQAINLLKDIKPDDPLHDKALVMIADLSAKKGSAAQMIEGMPVEQYFSQKLQAARTAYDAHDFSGAKVAFEDAIKVKPLPPDARALYDSAAQQVAKLDSAKALFAERKYSEAISNLQSLLEQDPQNQNIHRLILDAHFNLGAQALQEERTQDAIREFDEVLKVTPDDDLARRSRELAQRYDGETKDLLYKIYVKYLPLRQAT